MKHLTIVIPVYNEVGNFKNFLEHLNTVCEALSDRPELIVVDDGSDLATKQEITESIKIWKGPIYLITHPKNLGLGAAIKTGYCRAATEWVGWLPSDGQFSFQDIVRLYQNKGDSLVAVGRVSGWQRIKSDNLIRYIMSASSRFIMRLLHPQMPPFNGIMICKKSLFNPQSLVCTTGFINMEILDRIRRNHPAVNTYECLVEILPRISGCSKVANFKTITSTVLDLFWLRFDYICNGIFYDRKKIISQ